MDRNGPRWAWLVGGVVVTSVLVSTFPQRASARTVEQDQSPRVGLLVVDHGEPPAYNERTYESFREFFNHLIEMGLVPAWLKAIDTGTVMQDRNCYACTEISSSPDLMDAWLDPYDGPANYVPASDSLPGHYTIPGGPGQGEPDIFEHVGLGAWHEWELMGGTSPNYRQKFAKKKTVLARVARSFPDVPVAIGYGIDPRLNGGTQGFRPAIASLINKDRVDHIVVAYHGVGFSDIMQTHMIRHEVEEIGAAFDPKVTFSYADSMGMTPSYVRAITDKVQAEISKLPDSAPVAIHLSGHGLSTTTCGEYDCGADAYHAASADLFAKVKTAISKRIDRKGRLGVFHLYGDGADDENDPDDLVDSPMEALAKRKEAGFDYVVDIPHEFDSDSRDTLIILRQGYERPIPDWNDSYVSRYRYKGMRVRITNTQFGSMLKANAFFEVIAKALRHGATGGHDH